MHKGLSNLELEKQARWDETFLIPVEEYRKVVKVMIGRSPLSLSAIMRRLHLPRTTGYRLLYKSAPSPLMRRAIVMTLQKLEREMGVMYPEKETP